MEPLVALVRRWALDWLGRGDPAVCSELFADDYVLHIGGHRLEGRDAYVTATVEGLLERFPGVGVTVHELICNGDRAAARVTEHGAAARDGAAAAWGVVTLFAWDGARLTEGWAEEDYLARRRQLAAGACDPIEPPAPAPWSTVAVAPDPAAEEAVRAWLAAGELACVHVDDGWPQGGDEVTAPDPTIGEAPVGALDPAVADALAGAVTEVDDLFSAGDRVAFHAVRRGRDAGGPQGDVALHLAGLVRARDGAVVSGRVIRDRLGAQRALKR